MGKIKYLIKLYALDISYAILLSISYHHSYYFFHARKMFNLVCHFCMHSEMSNERKKKKRTPHTLERTPGMVGNEEYVLPPLTYASVDESMGNYNNYRT